MKRLYICITHVSGVDSHVSGRGKGRRGGGGCVVCVLTSAASPHYTDHCRLPAGGSVRAYWPKPGRTACLLFLFVIFIRPERAVRVRGRACVRCSQRVGHGKFPRGSHAPSGGVGWSIRAIRQPDQSHWLVWHLRVGMGVLFMVGKARGETGAVHWAKLRAAGHRFVRMITW